MKEAGFVNVTERIIRIPLGSWPASRKMKAVGMYWRSVLMDGLYPTAIGPLTRAFGWSREQVEIFLINVRRAYMDLGQLNECCMYMNLHIIYGQKPESH